MQVIKYAERHKDTL